MDRFRQQNYNPHLVRSRLGMLLSPEDRARVSDELKALRTKEVRTQKRSCTLCRKSEHSSFYIANFGGTGAGSWASCEVPTKKKWGDHALREYHWSSLRTRSAAPSTDRILASGRPGVISGTPGHVIRPGQSSPIFPSQLARV